jgi:adenosylcobinamide-phosphate synthase
LSVLFDRLFAVVAGQWSWLLVAMLAAPGLAQRSLHDHVRPIAEAIEAKDLPAARAAVGMIVGRDTGSLDDAGIARAAIESLSESFCDGVAAPLFWLMLLGLPGIWIYKAINTADSLIGHREERWRTFGWAAARTDDVLNLIPARIAGLLICLSGGGGWRIMWRDAGKHASPNAGWPEAAMAGALGLKLAGPISYNGMISDKPWIGSGARTASATEIRRALVLYRRACLCLWLIAGGIAWAL